MTGRIYPFVYLKTHAKRLDCERLSHPISSPSRLTEELLLNSFLSDERCDYNKPRDTYSNNEKGMQDIVEPPVQFSNDLILLISRAHTLKRNIKNNYG